jgi:hypothetical protein
LASPQGSPQCSPRGNHLRSPRDSLRAIPRPRPPPTRLKCGGPGPSTDSWPTM